MLEMVGLLLACVCAVAGCRLTRLPAGSGVSDVVDVYNSASGLWSTARLSVANQSLLAATSVRNVAIFAGGLKSNS